MNDLEKIRDNLIAESFEELKADDIQIEYQQLEDALIEWGLLTEEGFYIEVDNCLKACPRKE